MSESHNFKLVDKQYSEDLESDLYEFEHEKSGARLAVIKNDDPNKVFFIGFRTPSKNSTGVAHILEHSTLTGSRRYPVKEPFVELVKGSLNTFLNAMTYADRTVYPVASTNDADFRNLMEVYLDAVFYPRIYDSPYTFRQEGWHHHLENEEDDIVYNGVVYNEMKGVFSDPDAHVERLTEMSLFPDTVYHYESGGDPGEIPNLSYEDFLEFHKKFYHPANSYIYLYGDIDLDKELEYLDSWLDDFEKIEVDSKIEIQEPFKERLEVTGRHPIMPGESKENKDYMTLNYVLWPDMTGTERLMLTIAADFLLNDVASVLKKALIEANLAGEVDVSINTTILQPTITIFLKNTDINKKEEFVKIVEDVLKDVVDGKYDKEKLEAVINSNEFRTLEILSGDDSNFPRGLLLGLSMMEVWPYDNSPFNKLDFSQQYESLRESIKNGGFEDFIRKAFLENPHQALVNSVPDETILIENERALRKELDEYKKSLSEDELKNLVEETRKLIEVQSAQDTPEDLATIPHIHVSDIEREGQRVEYSVEDIDGVPLIYVEGGSKDIVYLTLEFDLRALNVDELAAYAIFEGILGTVATVNYDYEELNKLICKNTGGFSSSTYIGENRDTDELISNFKFQVKFRAEKASETIAILKEILTGSVFDDKELIKKLVTEIRLEDKSNITNHANASAAMRLRSYNSKSGRLAERISGIEEYEYLADIDDYFDDRWEGLKRDLESIFNKLINRNTLTLGLACQEAYKTTIIRALSTFIEALPKNAPELEAFDLKPLTPREAFIIGGNVNYNAKGGSLSREKIEPLGSFRVLGTILSMDYLWNKIRVLGGAYGTGFRVNNAGDIVMTSFRDPHLEETFESYDKSIDYVKNLDLNQEELEKYIIGTISPNETPFSLKQKLRRAMNMYFTNLSNEKLQSEREEILDSTLEDLKGHIGELEEVIGDDYYVTIGTESEIKKNADKFEKIHTIH